VLLDTCVVSELQGPQSEARVRACIDTFEDSEIFVSVITIGEVVKGIELLPSGRRRRELATWKLGLERHFSDRILPLDSEIVHRWGELSASIHRQGYTIGAEDGLIAATAIRHGLQVLTRNTRHFSATGVQLINPWEW
jgi:predicted nucleic acid-binding protein